MTKTATCGAEVDVLPVKENETGDLPDGSFWSSQDFLAKGRWEKEAACGKEKSGRR